MTKRIVNLAKPIVVRYVEDVLDSYPHYPYQKAFSIPDMRQKLMCFVLSRLPGMYVVMDEDAISSVDSEALVESLEQDKRIRGLVREGIQRITTENSDWIVHHLPENVSAQSIPSTWFG